MRPPDFIEALQYSERNLSEGYVFDHVILDSLGPYVPVMVDRVVLEKRTYWNNFMFAVGYHCPNYRVTFFTQDLDELKGHNCKAEKARFDLLCQ